MMRSVIRTVLFLCGSGMLVMTAGRPARAQDGPLCARPEILTFAAEHLRQSEAHVALVADTATEAGTPQSNVVLCVVTVQISIYDPADYRGYPAVIL